MRPSDCFNLQRRIFSWCPDSSTSGTPAPKGLLDPGASVEFEVRMELPQLAAAKGGYGVVWAE